MTGTGQQTAEQSTMGIALTLPTNRTRFESFLKLFVYLIRSMHYTNTGFITPGNMIINQFYVPTWIVLKIEHFDGVLTDPGTKNYFRLNYCRFTYVAFAFTFS
jgi:hypothetical protein